MLARFQTSRIRCLAGIILTASLPSGCGDIPYWFGQPVTRIVLKNSGKFAVDAVFLVSSNRDISEGELDNSGEKQLYTISAGDSVVFVRDCVTCQAIRVKGTLRSFGDSGPKAQSAVLRAGADFNCRSSVEFKFDHSDAVFDFNVSTTVQPSP